MLGVDFPNLTCEGSQNGHLGKIFDFWPVLANLRSIFAPFSAFFAKKLGKNKKKTGHKLDQSGQIPGIGSAGPDQLDGISWMGSAGRDQLDRSTGSGQLG